MIVSYSPRQVADSESYSPSATKPRLLLEYLQAQNYPLEVVEPSPLVLEDFYRVHNQRFVNGIMSLTMPNGFGNYSSGVCRSLPYTSGSMYQACCEALKYGVAASFSSGFHHAGWDHCSGFCTFNGLMVSAQKLLVEGQVKRILILDCDEHYGNGTANIIKKLKLEKKVWHESFGDRGYRDGGDGYLNRLSSVLQTLKQNPVGLVIFQAGADVHVDDPLGGTLTTAEMFERDRMVFSVCLADNIPLAFNLAGGYQVDNQHEAGTIEHLLPVLKLHEQTFSIAQTVLNRSYYRALIGA